MTHKPASRNNLISLLAFGSIFLGTGILIMLVSLDIIHVPPENIHAPRWVITSASATFATAGVMVVVNGLKEMVGKDSPILQWLSTSLALFFMLSLALPFHWIAFGPGERQFTSTVSLGPVSASQSGHETGGRLAFGFFALLMDAFMAFILYRIFTGKRLEN